MIRLLQHIEDCPLDSTHTLACAHRAAGIHSKEEGVANTLFTYLLTQILLLDVERTAIVLTQALIRRSSANRRVKGEVADLALRLLCTHITSLLQVGLRHTALAAATAHIAVLTQIQQHLRQAERFVNIGNLLLRSQIAVILFLLLLILISALVIILRLICSIIIVSAIIERRRGQLTVIVIVLLILRRIILVLLAVVLALVILLLLRLFALLLGRLTHAVRQHELRRFLDILRQHIAASGKSRQRPRCLQQIKLCPMPRAIGLRTQLRRQHQHSVRSCNLRQKLPSSRQLRCQLLRFLSVASAEVKYIPAICQGTLHNLHALLHSSQGLHINIHAKAVENMWRQRSLLGIHRRDKRRAYSMTAADAVTLHIIHACAVRIKHSRQKLLTQQVSLINIKDIVRRPRQKPR